MAFGDFINSFSNNIKNGINAIGTGIGNTVNNIKDWWQETKEKVNKANEEKGIINAIGTGIGATVGGIKNTVNNTIDSIKDGFNPQNKNEDVNEETNVNGNSTPNTTNEQTETQKETSNQENMLEKYWEREDQIRKETQEREDNAYQRAVNDMRKSGINPNLVGINPANSGGGITNASRIEETKSAEISAEINKYIAELQNNTKIDQAEKDRIANLLNKIIGSITLLNIK